ncbi:MAG: DUF4159 domain-containing protein [Acidobacteria bacterium]|nr:DUF4159 domain-containing protein [Acidobacteriota bacterium]
MKVIAGVLLVSLLLALAPSAQSQRGMRRPDFSEEGRINRNSRHTSRPHGEYTFARLIYESNGWRRMWTTDYPKADEQFIVGLRDWVRSGLAISDDPISVSMQDPKIFKYPFVYAVEPGFMELSEDDAAKLREYLLRGGLLMLDDFWGEYEWQNVQEQVRKIFPEYTIKELPLDHPLFHCYFDIDEVVQVPNVDNIIYRGRTDEKGGVVPHYEAVVNDEDGRVMIFIARNADNGDAWEWIDEPRYPLKYGLAAYRLGMNVIVYSMTH